MTMVSPRARQSSVEADKDITTPFLIRCYVTPKSHTPLQEFDDGLFPLRDEYQVYAWKDDSPAHLISLLLPSMPPSHRSPHARFHIRLLYADTSAKDTRRSSRGVYKYKDLTTVVGKDILRSSGDDRSLDSYRFVTGDCLSIAVTLPEMRGGGGGAQGSAGAGAAGRQSFGWDGSNANGGGPGSGLSIRGRGGVRPSFNGRDRERDIDEEPAGGGNWRGRGRGGGPPAGVVGGRERDNQREREMARGGGARRRTPSPLRERELERQRAAERERSGSPMKKD